MIELHTLGVVDLRASDGRELGTILRQPKRLGLLAYLAVASPRRFHRRDSLLALFWPELDQDHARAVARSRRPRGSGRMYGAIAERSPYELIYAGPARARLSE
ncbi:MAG: hypothetical protein H0V43_09980 [Gemmatimonadales bacterium]|nr:hypothetical protein [Gemmatimonadales bacterium]MBA3556271.1 hypothetical protein [Gemmatimonadales bacterium]